MGGEGVGNGPAYARTRCDRSRLAQAAIGGGEGVYPVQITGTGEIERLGLDHRETVTIGVARCVRRGGAGLTGVVEGRACHWVGVLDQNAVSQTHAQGRVLAGGRRCCRRCDQAAAEDASIGAGFGQADRLHLASAVVGHRHGQGLYRERVGVLIAVGDLDVQRVAFSEVDEGVGVGGVEKPDLTVGRSRWRYEDASGQLQVGIAPAGVGRGGDAPIDWVVDAGGPAVLAGGGVCVFRLDVIARDQDQFATVVCRVRAAGGSDQGALEDASVDASLRQDDLFNLTVGGVGHLDRQGLSHSAVFVLVAVDHTESDVVGTPPVAGHGFGEARVHEEHFAIGHRHGDLGLVDFVLLNARASQGHAVGDGVVTVGQRLIDGAPDLDPVGDFHHAAALESVGHVGGAGVQIGDAVTRPSQGEGRAGQAAVGDSTGDGYPIGGIESLRGPGNRPGPFALGRVDRHQRAVGHVFGAVGRRDGVLEHDVIEIDHSPVGQGHRVGDLFAQFNDRVVVAGSSLHRGRGFGRRFAQDVVRKGRDGRTHVQVGGAGPGDRWVFTPGGGDQGAVLGVHR